MLENFTACKRTAPAILVLALLFSAPTLVEAHSCGARQWTYSIADLTEVRRRLKSDAIQSLTTRVECATTILSSSGLTEPFPDCPDCAPEYAGLLSDSAVIMREANVRVATTDAAKKNYYTLEMDTRRRLHDFLSQESQAAIRPRYLTKNLLALTDTMERLGMAIEYHQFVSELSENTKLEIQMYRVWIKAVRSCAAWNFKSNDDVRQLRASLCNQECVASLESLHNQLREATLLDAAGRVKPFLPALPIPSECSARDGDVST